MTMNTMPKDDSLRRELAALERVRLLERGAEVMRSQLATAHRFISLIPKMQAAAVRRDELALKAFEMQGKQFGLQVLSPAEQQSLDAEIARLGERQALQEQHSRTIAAIIVQHTEELAHNRARHEQQVAVLEKNAIVWQEQVGEQRTRIQELARQSLQEERWRSYMLSQFDKIIDVLRGFEGSMAEQVRRRCNRVLERAAKWTPGRPEEDDQC